MSKLNRLIFLFIALIPLICACKRVASVPPLEATNYTLAWLERRYSFLEDPLWAALLRRVAGRLSRAIYGQAMGNGLSEDFCRRVGMERDCSRYPWRVFILNSDRNESFALGSGVVVITSGLLEGLDTESELAAILGHEMAHDILGHPFDLSGLRDDPTSPLVFFSFEREIEADLLSLKILKLAAYNPCASLSALDAFGGEETVSPYDDWQGFRKAYMAMHMRGSASCCLGYLDINTREFNRAKIRLSRIKE